MLVSNSEDVPCTKWPPARRSKRVEEAVVYPRRNTPKVEGEVRARRARFLYIRLV